MSTQDSIQKNSKSGLAVIILCAALLLGFVFYAIELAPAKSWNIKSLAECSLSLKDKELGAEILEQVSDTPRIGKIDRLNTKCRQLREREKIIEANLLMAQAKETLNESD